MRTDARTLPFPQLPVAVGYSSPPRLRYYLVYGLRLQHHAGTPDCSCHSSVTFTCLPPRLERLPFTLRTRLRLPCGHTITVEHLYPHARGLPFCVALRVAVLTLRLRFTFCSFPRLDLLPVTFTRLLPDLRARVDLNSYVCWFTCTGGCVRARFAGCAAQLHYRLFWTLLLIYGYGLRLRLFVGRLR